MNFQYLDDLANRVGVKSRNKRPLKELLRNSRVFSFLKRFNYSTVAFPTGWRLTELRDADVYMSEEIWALNDFSGELVYNTPIAVLIELFANRPFKHILRRRRILYSFEYLADTLEMEPPIFVFAHIACPHGPFVFDKDGNFISPVKATGEFSKEDLYVDQVKFLNSKVIEVVDSLLANSAQRPIIILQGDHGVRWKLHDEKLERNTPQVYKECFSILNAYYLPGYDYTQLYDSITPVNTFRVVFNHYFGTKYQILRDEMYFSPRSQPYNFTKVTEAFQ